MANIEATVCGSCQAKRRKLPDMSTKTITTPGKQRLGVANVPSFQEVIRGLQAFLNGKHKNV